jgi:ABC-type Fe3+-hydroxamate transport system substrate-binding protein
LASEIPAAFSLILTELGVPKPPITEAADEPKNGGYLGSVSLERIPDMSSDVIFLEHKTPGEDDKYQDDYTGHPLWQALPAVDAEQVHLTDEMYYGTTFGVYQYVLEQIGPALVSADEGTVEASWENAVGE